MFLSEKMFEECFASLNPTVKPQFVFSRESNSGLIIKLFLASKPKTNANLIIQFFINPLSGVDNFAFVITTHFDNKKIIFSKTNISFIINFLEEIATKIENISNIMNESRNMLTNVIRESIKNAQNNI